MLTLGVLCSGSLGFSTLEHIVENYSVRFILTDKKSDEIISFSEERKIPVFIGNPRDGCGFKFIEKKEVDVIASINYLFLIEKDIINHAKKLAFNIHGSLLPKYRGRTPHVWAIINGEKEAGITAHIIDANCDTGEIIDQIKVTITPENTGADILNKYARLYIPLFDKVLDFIKQENLKTIKQDNSKATYFGKRAPEDGEISWNWGKARIKNWIRAQAHPYPGAFTFLDGKKVIIDKVSTSNTFIPGKNGQIVFIKPKVMIKVKDGLVILEDIRSKNPIFSLGKRLTNEDRK